METPGRNRGVGYETSLEPRLQMHPPCTDTHNFADLHAKLAEDFQTPEGINHSVAQLFRVLASGLPRQAPPQTFAIT